MVGGKVIMPAELQRFILNAAGLARRRPACRLALCWAHHLVTDGPPRLGARGGAYDREPAPCYTTRADGLLRVTAC